MPKKKATKKKTTKKRATKPAPPMSKGFGHLTIRPTWRVTGESRVEGGEDPRPDSQKCWEDWGEYDDW